MSKITTLVLHGMKTCPYRGDFNELSRIFWPPFAVREPPDIDEWGCISNELLRRIRRVNSNGFRDHCYPYVASVFGYKEVPTSTWT